MTRIYQTDKRLPWHVNKYGCHFRSLICPVERITGKPFTPTEIIETLRLAENQRIVISDVDAKGDDLKPEEIEANHALLMKTLGCIIKPADRWLCFVMDPKRLIDTAFHVVGMYGRRVKYLRKKGLIDGVASLTFHDGMVTDTILEGIPVNSYSHFRYGDEKGNEIFDPYNPKPELKGERSIRYLEVI